MEGYTYDCNECGNTFVYSDSHSKILSQTEIEVRDDYPMKSGSVCKPCGRKLEHAGKIEYDKGLYFRT